jgi:glycosyltransferase involved in cell wall biosynthesis
LEQARDLQRRQKYPRVLLVYVLHSKILEAFPDPCWRIMDTQDILSNRRQRLLADGVTSYWRSYSVKDERRGLLRAQRIIAIQEHEAVYFRRLLGSTSKVYTVGHFGEALRQPPPPAPFLRLGCIGSRNAVNRHGWQWFLHEVWPKVQNRLPGVEIWLAGSICEKFPPTPGVRALGQISSLSDFYRDCPVLINPVRTGTGLKIKTIEALMHGRPVVTTQVGAEGLESFLGHGLLVGNSAEEFANAIVVLLSNLSQAQQAGEAAVRQSQSYFAENQRVFAQILS